VVQDIGDATVVVPLPVDPRVHGDSDATPMPDVNPALS
jgi:hypothetical protein